MEDYKLTFEKGTQLIIDEEVDEKVIEDIFNNFINEIKDAENKAVEQGIEANAIILNDKYDYCKSFYYSINYSLREIPPMILGKEIYLGTLPKQYKFALFHRGETTMEKLERENALLKKYIKILGEDENEQLVFKGVSPKRNKEDFKKLKEILYD